MRDPWQTIRMDNPTTGLYCEGCGEWVDTNDSHLKPEIARQGEYNGEPGRVSIIVFRKPAEPDGRYRGELGHQCLPGSYVPDGQIAPRKPALAVP